MQRAHATAGRRVGALGAGLALPFFSFLAQAAPLEGRSAAAPPPPAHSSAWVARAGESALTRWHNYALASITPQFSWALRPESLSAPDVLDPYSGEAVREPRFNVREAAPTRLSVSIASGVVTDTPSVLPERSSQWIGIPQPGLQRTVVAPSLAHTWGDHGSVRLTGVLAYQRFASLGLGTAAATDWAPLPAWLRDSSYGAGARIDLGTTFGEGLRWNAAYQSRVAMGAFASYRGVFADAGHFDIPASASANLAYALTPNLGVDVGVQRVMYSAITPFTSSNLPVRFLALLGDSASPVFAWRDLSVYSAGWTLRDADIGTLELRYTTRQQPVPTSQLLERALAGATANDTISFGWSRGFGANTNLRFSASYASAPYYLMMPSYLPRQDATASQFEFEALWSTRF